MAKVGSRRTGGAGIATDTLTGFIRFISGSEPVVFDLASQAEAEAGSSNEKLMTPLRVHQAMADYLQGSSISLRANEMAAPTTSNNANENDDQGNPLRVGSLWRYDTGSGTTEERWKWYELQGFSGTDAIWLQTDSITSSIIDSLDSRLDTAEGEIDTLQSDVIALDGRLDTAEGEIDTLQSDVISLDGRLDTAESEIDTLQSDVISLDSRLDTAESEIDTLQTDVTALDSRLDTAESEIDTAQSDITSLDSRVDTLEGYLRVSLKLSGSAPTTSDNASQLDDYGNNFRVGSLWRHDKGSGSGEELYDWYRLEGFDPMNGSDAIWALAEQIDASVINDITSDISSLESRMTTAEGDIDTLQSDATSLAGRVTTAEGEIDTLQSNVSTAQSDITSLDGRVDTAEGEIDTLQSSVSTAQSDITSLDGRVDTAESEIDTLQSALSAAEALITLLRSNVFDSAALFTVANSEVIIELNSVPNDNSLSIKGQTSGSLGLFPFIEDKDYDYLGSWVFMRNATNGDAGSGDRSVDNGDVLDIDWFTDQNRVGAVADFADAVASGTVQWTDPGSGFVELYKCANGADETKMENWVRVNSYATGTTSANGFTNGDRVIARRLTDNTNATTRKNTCGIWSSIVTVS